jgi:hypothetical protein
MSEQVKGDWNIKYARIAWTMHINGHGRMSIALKLARSTESVRSFINKVTSPSCANTENKPFHAVFPYSRTVYIGKNRNHKEWNAQEFKVFKRGRRVGLSHKRLGFLLGRSEEQIQKKEQEVGCSIKRPTIWSLKDE